MLPLPPPLRINTPVPSTSIAPLKFVFPRIVNVPVTTRNPAPLVRVQSPSTNVNIGVFNESLIVVPELKYRPVDCAWVCRLLRYARARSAVFRNEGVSTVPAVVSSSPSRPTSGSTTVSGFLIPALASSSSQGETANAGRCASTPAWSTPEYHFAPLLPVSSDNGVQSSAPRKVTPAGSSKSRFALLTISSKRFFAPCGPKPYDLSNRRFGSGEVKLAGIKVVLGDEL